MHLLSGAVFGYRNLQCWMGRLWGKTPAPPFSLFYAVALIAWAAVGSTRMPGPIVLVKVTLLI